MGSSANTPKVSISCSCSLFFPPSAWTPNKASSRACASSLKQSVGKHRYIVISRLIVRLYQFFGVILSKSILVDPLPVKIPYNHGGTESGLTLTHSQLWRQLEVQAEILLCEGVQQYRDLARSSAGLVWVHRRCDVLPPHGCPSTLFVLFLKEFCCFRSRLACLPRTFRCRVCLL